MTTQEFLYCLGRTESNNDPNVALGDGGRALGRFQVHPDWAWGYARRFGVQPALNETWDSFITRIVVAFYDHFCGGMPALEVAMYFHVGHPVRPGDKDWDGDYAARFSGFWGPT